MVIVRRVGHRFDKGFLVMLAISLLAIWPFISRSSLPQGTDAELHIFRLHELSYLVRHGEWYPRWAPDFYHGYGYPIFNYYAPLTYYLGVAVDLLPRLDAVAGVKAVFILGLLLAGLGMYGFVRDNWGRPAAYVSTAVYLYAPYIQYIDPHARGVLPESFSFGLFPVALWALDRVGRGGGKWAWISAVFSTAAIILSHNLMGLLFSGLLFAWAVWRAVERPVGQPRFLPIAALFLGLGLAAFFWLPVILERDAVNLNTMLGRGDNYDFHTHFLTWQELLAPSKRLDWGATQPDFRFNLGVAQWVLGGLGLLLLLARRCKDSRQLTFFALVLAALVFMMLPISAFVWETIPFLPFFQFPWRFLGAAAAMLAILAGAGAAVVLESSVAGRVIRYTGSVGWLTAVLVILPILFGLPLTQPAPWPDFGDVFTARMSEIELKGRWLGTTSTSDYVPVTVDTIPKRNGSVVAPIYQGQPPDWVNWVAMPEGALVRPETVTPLYVRYTVDAPKNFRLRLFLFDFPGWRVRIDGERVQTELGRPEGFIVIPVPAGRHLVEVDFGPTLDRTLAWAVSVASLLLALLIARRYPAHPGSGKVASLTRGDGLVLGVVLGVTAVTLIFLHPLGWLHASSADFVAEPADTAVFVDFGQQITLIGYDLSSTEFSPGDEVEMTLYWQAESPLAINYQVFVHLLRADGSLVAQSDKLNPGEFPTRQWPLDKYVRDEHRLPIPPNLAAGEYRITVGLWVQNEGWRLPVFDENEQQIGDSFRLATIRVD